MQKQGSVLAKTILQALVMLVFLSGQYAFCGDLSLRWNSNRESDIAGYKLHYGSASRDYEFAVDVGNETNYTICGLQNGQAYYCAASAYDTQGNESDFSEEVVHVVAPPEPTVYEDAEDGTVNGWDVYDNDPPGMEISNVLDDERQSHVIELSGFGWENGACLRNPDLTLWQNAGHFVIQWSMKYCESFTIYIDVETTAGHRYVYYTPLDYDALGGAEYVHHGLGTHMIDGQWRTFVRNLEADLHQAQPGISIIEVNGFLIRGSGRVDDIILHDEMPSDADGDGINDAEEIAVYGADPTLVDSDGDGLNDGDELDFWQDDWAGDIDEDGLVNLLDPDSDSDGYLDGEEIGDGSDPSDPYSSPLAGTWTDYRVSLTMASNDNDAIGIMFRFQDAGNFYRFSWSRQCEYRRLVKCEDGIFTLLAEDRATYLTGESYDVEVVAEGTTLEVFIDDELVFSVTDPSFSSGTIGLYSWANQGSLFDDVVVEDLSTGVVVLWEDFEDGDYSGWRVVDEGIYQGPSLWSAESGAMVQSSNIHSSSIDRADMHRLGTFAVYQGATAPSAFGTDYRVSLTMGSNDNDAIGIMFRFQDADNYYRFSWDKQRYCRRLVKCENGVFTLLAEDSVRYVTGETYEAEVVAEGTTLEVFIDDELVFSVTDQSFSGGTIGLYAWANQGSLFDDVVVEDLSTGTVVLWEDFGDGDYSGWSIVDEGIHQGPSTWSAESGVLVQSANIHSGPTDRAELSKLGTYLLKE